jgi:hypothetical protein
MPINTLLHEMTYEEMLGWFAYFEARPVDWRADDRAYKFLQTQGAKEKPWNYFSSLIPIYKANSKPREDGKMSANNFMASALFHKLQGAVGGDKVILE